MAQREWYASGLRFECTLCGNCCTGPEGYVLITREEIKGAAAKVGMEVGEFMVRFVHKVPEGLSLNERETEHGFDCVFLDRESMPGKAVCRLYEARPLQCRTFPWWPENLKSEQTWNRVANHCEGVGRGPLVPIEAIRIERDRQERDTPSGGPSR